MMFRWRIIIACGVSLIGRTTASAQVPAELDGRVRDAANAHPIVGAIVELDETNDRTTSDADGRFVVRGLEPGSHHVRVRAVGFAPYESEATVVNGLAVSIEIELHAIAVALSALRVIASVADTTGPGATTFDRETIERSGHRDVGELLASAPSVVITQGGGPGSPSRISIRGSGSSEVLVLVDGVPVNSPITGAADLSRLSLETIERVSVRPGTQSARYGPRALAGVVVIETRHARRELAVATSAGAFGESAVSGTAGEAASLEAGGLSASITARRRYANGDFRYHIPAVRGGGTARRTNADVGSTNVSSAASLETDRAVVRAHGDVENTKRGVPGSIVQPSSAGRSYERRASGGLDVRAALRGVTVTAAGDLADDHSHLVDLDPPFGGVYDDRVEARTARATSSAMWAGHVATISAGGDAEQLAIRATSLDGDPGHQDLTGVWLDARRTADVGAGMSMTASAGVRSDWDSLLRGSTVSPRGVLSMDRGVASLTFSVGNGFSPPSLADQFFHEGVLVQPNPNLRPERVRGETELRLALHNLAIGPLTATSEAAAYRANVDGMILWTPNFRFIWSPSNFDVQRRGWEASTRLAAESLGLALTGSVNRSDVTYAGSVLTGQVVYRPVTTATADIAISRRTARLDVDTRYVGARRSAAGSSLNLLEPYWLTDASLDVPATFGHWTADGTIGLTNIFDRPAAMLVDYPYGGRAWTIGVRIRRAGTAGVRQRTR